MYIALWQGLTTPWEQNFDDNRNILSLRSFVASFKQISLKSDFIHFFMILYMYIVPGQGQTAPRGPNFNVNRKALSLYPFVASFKEIPFKSDFIQFFHDLIHVCSPGAGGIYICNSPRGQSFDVNRNFLSLWLSVASFKS